MSKKIRILHLGVSPDISIPAQQHLWFIYDGKVGIRASSLKVGMREWKKRYGNRGNFVRYRGIQRVSEPVSTIGGFLNMKITDVVRRS